MIFWYLYRLHALRKLILYKRGHECPFAPDKNIVAFKLNNKKVAFSCFFGNIYSII